MNALFCLLLLWKIFIDEYFFVISDGFQVGTLYLYFFMKEKKEGFCEREKS